MVDVTFYGFRANRIYIPKPRVENGEVKEIPFISFYNDKDFMQVTIFFDSYEEMEKILADAYDRVRDTIKLVEKLKTEGEGKE